MICELRCADVITCVFYQLDDNRCYLCIHSNTEYTSANLVSHDAVADATAHLRNGIADVIFTSYSCTGEMYPAEREENFYDTHDEDIEMLRFCSSTWYTLGGLVAGYWIRYADGQRSPMVRGCNTERTYPFEDMYLDTDEVVLHVRFCIGTASGYHVLQEVMLATDRQIFGPIGDSTSCTYYYANGYKLQGFRGWAAAATDAIGANFERC